MLTVAEVADVAVGLIDSPELVRIHPPVRGFLAQLVRPFPGLNLKILRRFKKIGARNRQRRRVKNLLVSADPSGRPRRCVVALTGQHAAMRYAPFVRRCVVLTMLAACSFTSPGSDPNPDPDPDPDASVDVDAIAVVDTDNDGVPDGDDNCPELANPGQFDEDGDLLGDSCDNCPHIANAGQEDSTEVAAGGTADSVGDACESDARRPRHPGAVPRL